VAQEFDPESGCAHELAMGGGRYDAAAAGAGDRRFSPGPIV